MKVQVHEGIEEFISLSVLQRFLYAIVYQYIFQVFNVLFYGYNKNIIEDKYEIRLIFIFERL